MSVWAKLRGTVETIFQLGLGGPNLKANGAVVEARDAADTAFVIVRGLTPVAANDLTTKGYVDSGTLGGALREVRIPIALAATTDSVTILPAGANVRRVAVEPTTPYSAGATIAVGQAGSTSLLMGTTDSNPQAAGIYESSLDQAWGAAPLAVRVTIGGAPAAGAGVVIVEYSTPAV